MPRKSIQRQQEAGECLNVNLDNCMTKKHPTGCPKEKEEAEKRFASIEFAGLSYGKNDTNQLLHCTRNSHIVMFPFLKILGKINSKVGIPFNERFMKLNENYENEQKTLKNRISELQSLVAL